MKRLAKMIQKFSVDADSNIYKITVTEYEKINGKNKEIRISTSDGNNPLVVETENIYNEHGDLVRALFHGKVQEINTYEYDDRGRKIVQYSFFEDTKIPNRDGSNDDLYWKMLLEQFSDVGIEKIEHKYGPIGFMKTVWDYTRHIRTDYMPYLENNEIKLALVQKCLYINNQFNVCKRHEEYIYDELVSVMRYKYDKAGNLIKVVSTEYNGSIRYENTKTYTYDSNNRPLFERSECISKVYKNKKIVRKDNISTFSKEFEYFAIPRCLGMEGTIVKISETNVYPPTDVDREIALTAHTIIIKDSNDRKVLEMYEDSELSHTVMRDIEYYEDGMIKHDIKRTAVDCEEHLYDAISYEYEYVEE